MGRLQWAFIVIVTAVIVVTAPSDNEGDSANTARTTRQRAVNSASVSPNPDKQRPKETGHVELERLDRSGLQQEKNRGVGDAFNATSWHVQPPPPRFVPAPPPPPPLPPQAAPAPTAPPLPFTYMGRYSDTESRFIILTKGDRVYTVAVGDVIENTYRVEKITAGMVNLTYLPLNIEQSLRTGEAL